MTPTVFNHILLPYPPAFAIASPSPERGEAMVKAGGEPSCRAGAEQPHVFVLAISRVSFVRDRGWWLRGECNPFGVATGFYSCRSSDRSPGMHSSRDDSKPELGEPTHLTHGAPMETPAL